MNKYLIFLISFLIVSCAQQEIHDTTGFLDVKRQDLSKYWTGKIMPSGTYPRSLSNAMQNACVFTKYSINSNGEVVNPQILSSIPKVKNDVISYSMRSFKRSKFKPSIENDNLIPVNTYHVFTFTVFEDHVSIDEAKIISANLKNQCENVLTNIVTGKSTTPSAS
ncbi:hypothetical protein NO559_16650 [Dasania sp. GY-MA-18]|uniref:TonB C-terminal domain-containing protein n=1 Tax=Dasania phycosphaerae TaxID=2950436 RepID=A0A9J6RSD1_9GAMM|nr:MULTISPECIES: hypothetical protein [Dasania]MCR8924405.1 hypothetical protein [Dasania sp. GY-MA-18]MCZ0867080.1 hypothetical protein [Dasania phycosphaerae]MCZ0870532.1 hypothetical protein [Dasania phycosphaerae]